MKKLFITLAFITLAFISMNAQEVGQWWIGGSAGFWSSKAKGSSSVTSYKILPEVGYALNQNLALGISLGYAHSDMGFEKLDLEVGEIDLFTVSPFVRMAFLQGDLGALFVDGGVSYAFADLKDFDEDLNMIEVGFRPGVAFNVSNRISLIGKFGFLGYQYIKAGDNKVNSFGLELDMSQFQVGACLKF